jgi:hypothetical protein
MLSDDPFLTGFANANLSAAAMGPTASLTVHHQVHCDTALLGGVSVSSAD